MTSLPRATGCSRSKQGPGERRRYSGCTEYVSGSGAVAEGVTLFQTQKTVFSSGLAADLVAMSGTGITVSSGGSGTDLGITSGAAIGVISGGSVTGLNVASGGNLFDIGAIALTSGNVVNVNGAVTCGTITVGAGATIEGSFQNGGVIRLLAGVTEESGLTLTNYYGPYGTMEMGSGVHYGSRIATVRPEPAQDSLAHGYGRRPDSC